MIVELEERVLIYKAEDLASWISGDKSIIPTFLEMASIIRNQPSRHFAEMLTLRHYHEAEQWKGFESYAIGAQYPASQRRTAGRRMIEEIIPSSKLAKLRNLRSQPAIVRSGGGEPDLFLYRDKGREFKFVEVKKGNDKLREPQLICIAQILAILQCEVDIVYVREASKAYTPKKYWFDLIQYTGGPA